MRAIEAMPRTCGSRLNSAARFGLGRAAHAGAGRVAALGHEAVDDAVEDDVVVKAFLGQLADPRDMAGREIGAQADDDVAAAVEVEDQGVELVAIHILPSTHPARSP